MAIGSRTFYLVNFLDEYSLNIVHHALVSSNYGTTVNVEAYANGSR